VLCGGATTGQEPTGFGPLSILRGPYATTAETLFYTWHKFGWSGVEAMAQTTRDAPFDVLTGLGFVLASIVLGFLMAWWRSP